MANRYWVGGTGNWDATTTHWSATSGGAGGASVPTSADDVFIDANSGASAAITVGATLNCLSLNFTGAITPTFDISAGLYSINIFGSLTLISTMTLTGTSIITFGSTTTSKTITTAGKTMYAITFDGVGGGWTFQDDITLTQNLTLTRGNLNTNGKTVTLSGSFNLSNSNTRTLTLGASTIYCGSSWTATTITGLTFNANTSTIFMSSTFSTFNGGGLSYNNVNFTATPITVTGSSTFNVFTILAGKTVKLTSATTQTITSLVCNGTLASPSTLQSTIAASPAAITLPAGRYFIRHTSIKDITISGATAVTSIAGTNVSGNTGITFVTKFEIGRIKNDGSFNWVDSTTGTLQIISSQYDEVSRQAIINGGFAVNQRVVSGTVTLTAGQYGHDRWKAGASGCTYTFSTSLNVTTITISAGSLIQVIEGINLFSGTYTLSWTGTAQGKIGAGSYSASGITGTVTGGTNLNIEFNTGTLSKVQFNVGSIALPFQPRSFADELVLCQRYYEKSYDYSILPGATLGSGLGYFAVNTGTATSNRITASIPYKVKKRIATSTLQVYDLVGNAGKITELDVSDSSVNNIAPTFKNTDENKIFISHNPTARGGISFAWTDDAEL